MNGSLDACATLSSMPMRPRRRSTAALRWVCPKSGADQVLVSLAHRKTGAIPAELSVRHIMSVTADAGWRVQRAAMEALLRRCSASKQDHLQVASTPRGASPFGHYATKRAEILDAAPLPHVSRQYRSFAG